ncbi:MAG: hypothetical protein MZV65_33610 [Chromatiales bacterium]|nr:hypothetical protein [Chromatiales bacterium]
MAQFLTLSRARPPGRRDARRTAAQDQGWRVRDLRGHGRRRRPAAGLSADPAARTMRCSSG